jgi:hypothetical protein
VQALAPRVTQSLLEQRFLESIIFIVGFIFGWNLANGKLQCGHDPPSLRARYHQFAAGIIKQGVTDAAETPAPKT